MKGKLYFTILKPSWDPGHLLIRFDLREESERTPDRLHQVWTFQDTVEIALNHCLS